MTWLECLIGIPAGLLIMAGFYYLGGWILNGIVGLIQDGSGDGPVGP